MDQCPYCGEELDDSEPPESLDADGKILWRHPMMACPELGEMVVSFPWQS